MGNSASSGILSEAPTLKETADFKGSYDEHKAPFWSEKADSSSKIVSAKQGVAANESITLFKLFDEAIAKHGDKPALAVERPCPPIEKKNDAAEWKFWTYKEYYNECKLAAKAFIALGLQPRDGVNIFGFNSPEWFMSEIGGMLAGGIAAGIYPSDTPDQVQYKSHHSSTSIACVESAKQAAVFRKLAEEGRLPKLKAIIVWDADAPFKTKKDGPVPEVHWSNLKEYASQTTDERLQERIDAQTPGSVCAYIYTSGTTGFPKAVMVTHDNVCFISSSVMMHCDTFGANAEEERCLSYLPLSHVAGMMIDIICPITVPARTPAWVTVYFARPYDLKVGTIGARLNAAQPTLFLGVPRVWEKMSEKLKAVGATITGMKKKVSTYSKKKGLAYARNCQMGGSGKKPSNMGVANKVLSAVSQRMGLAKMKYALTGAAPITLETLEYFGQLGIQINECYGMSESTGATTWSSGPAHVWGSCGWAVPGTEIKAFRFEDGKRIEAPPAKDLFRPTEEEQGELCFRGRHIMAGYMANPELGEEHVEEIRKKNMETIDEEGWLHSGDKGAIDARGCVRITGRYKELIITAGGENVAPVPIEDCIKALCPAVSNVMMIGDKRKFNIALVTLKCVGATGELPGSDELEGPAALLDPEAKTLEQAFESKKVIDAITQAITATNKNGKACPSNASTVQKFSILPIDFSVQTGELTATLKLKRSVATEKYMDLVEKIYASGDTFVKYDGPKPDAAKPEE